MVPNQYNILKDMSTFRRRLMTKEQKTIRPYMHIEALEDGLTVSLSYNAIEYSLDGRTWVTLPPNTASPAINTGEKIYFKGNLTPASNVGIGTFTLSKKCKAGGNSMSLLFWDNFENQYSLQGKNYAFYALFSGCTNLEGVSYDFLPATTLANYCYYSTFSNTSIKIAPLLPAKTLIPNCYTRMFYRCSSLSYIEAMFTTTPSSTYTSGWVNGVSSSGTFVKHIYADWDVRGVNGVPTNWILTHDIVNSGYIVGKFNVSSSSTVKICNSASVYQLASIMVDGVVKSVAANMYLSSGEHTIRFYIKGNYTSTLFQKDVPVYSLDFSKLNNSVDITSVCIQNTHVETVTIGNNIRDISNYAFQYCSNLKSVIFGTEVFTIGKYAFAYSGIQSINLSNTSIYRIYEFAFSHCYSLTTINFGTVEKLDADGIFSTASALTDIYISSTTAPPLLSTTFWNVKSGGTLHYPSGADYSEWMQESSYYLGYYNWTQEEVGQNGYYILDLNNQWQVSNVTNPDSSLYDGVYESFSNKGVNSTAAIMYIDIVGYTDFSLYIRSYAESNYDYVMVSQLDQTINNSTSYSDTTLVKAHTRGSQTSGTAIDDYKLVEFTGINGGEHRITILYRKDSSSSSGDDRGYLLIPKNQ